MLGPFYRTSRCERAQRSVLSFFMEDYMVCGLILYRIAHR
jgi:hypothetical protein